MKLQDKEYKLSTGVTKKLSELTGEKGLIMFCYPKAFTGYCTLEVQEYEKRKNEFIELGYNIVGVSGDDYKEQDKFSCEYEITYPLIADIDKELIKEIGAYEKDVNPFDTRRNTYVLKNNLELVKEFLDVNHLTHIDEVLKFIK